MSYWHGYVLIEQPAAVSAKQWPDVTGKLQEVLGKQDHAAMPAERMHWRFNRTHSAVILEAMFDARDLNEKDASRLGKHISEALGGAWTPAEIGTIFDGRVHVFAPGGRWQESRRACAEYLAQHAADWEPAEPAPMPRGGEE